MSLTQQFNEVCDEAVRLVVGPALVYGVVALLFLALFVAYRQFAG